MKANIIDGQKVAELLLATIKEKVDKRREKGQRVPGLSVILVGGDSASKIYVQKKRQRCSEMGFHSESHDLPETISQNELLSLIEKLNHDESIDGILVQSPLPSHIDFSVVLEKINPAKDVDGFHPYNMGRLAQKKPLLRPCTPYGIMKLLQHYQIHPKGQHVVIVGASNIVGRPMGLEFLLVGSTVTICHRFTRDLKEHVKHADILVVAIGKTGIVQSEWIKPGCVVIDVGMNRSETGKIVGDIDFPTASLHAGWITPVPGGVGPMTVATLLHNTMMAAEMRDEKRTDSPPFVKGLLHKSKS